MFVDKLPGLDPVLKSQLIMYSGQLNVTEKAKLFYWFFRANKLHKRQRLTVWLNGGPGCSSMDGLFLENGPFTISGDSLLPRQHSWNEYSNLVYVDQPVGTGYSVGSDIADIREATVHFIKFLEQFYVEFPETRQMDLYIAGESFAGIYIPHFAHEILQTTDFPLSGIAIGNGWMNPHYQYQAVYDYALKHSLLDGTYLEQAKSLLTSCTRELQDKPRLHGHDVCEEIHFTVMEQSRSNGQLCLNTYDIRLRDKHQGDGCGMKWPEPLSDLTPYLSREDVKEALHVQDHRKWRECDHNVHAHLVNSDPSGIHAGLLLPDILKRIPVHLYAGDMDLGCNWMGIYQMAKNMDFNGQKGIPDLQPWFLNKSLVGEYASARNLSLFVIYNASHMTPIDAPLASQEVANLLMNVDLGLSVFGKLPMDVPTGNQKESQKESQKDKPSNTPKPADFDPSIKDSSTQMVGFVLISSVVAVLGLFLLLTRGFRRLLHKRQFTRVPETELQNLS
ncbi:serine carboxypeptidase-domain-containing protein [Gorgonomyces haynaldii]|nr:serine carboxypeptidase-domain-containing protein [Gorgonomyces haynaldii]